MHYEAVDSLLSLPVPNLDSVPQTSPSDTQIRRCSMLGGQVITDYDGQGARKNSYVYAGGSLVYERLNGQSLWHVTNPLTGDARDTDATRKLVNDTHFDPLGVNTGASDPANKAGRKGVGWYYEKPNTVRS
jgi:hypothetical protein